MGDINAITNGQPRRQSLVPARQGRSNYRVKISRTPPNVLHHLHPNTYVYYKCGLDVWGPHFFFVFEKNYTFFSPLYYSFWLLFGKLLNGPWEFRSSQWSRNLDDSITRERRKLFSSNKLVTEKTGLFGWTQPSKVVGHNVLTDIFMLAKTKRSTEER